MDPLRYLSEKVGFFTTSQVRDAGYGDRDIAYLIRTEVWHRIRRGYYTFADAWLVLDDLGRHKVLSMAVLDSLGPSVALSHVSGAIQHGIAVWGVPLDRVHVTRLDGGAGRIERDVTHHEGFCHDEDVLLVNGRRVLKPERCAIEAACRIKGASPLALFDSLLHQRLCDKDTLLKQFDLMQHWPHVLHLRVPIRMADGLSESPGESRGRWLFWRYGLPAPQLQFQVFDANGLLKGTTDWGWPEHGVLGEFDGKMKYGRLLAPYQDPGEVVFAEKVREDELRELTGHAMFRLIWSDYSRPTVTVKRIETLLNRAA